MSYVHQLLALGKRISQCGYMFQASSSGNKGLQTLSLGSSRRNKVENHSFQFQSPEDPQMDTEGAWQTIL